jgi:hypothetical protein
MLIVRCLIWHIGVVLEVDIIVVEALITTDPILQVKANIFLK